MSEMLDTGLGDAVKAVPDPERRINLWAALIVVSVLWGILCLVIRSWGNDLRDENRQLKIDAKISDAVSKQKFDSLNALRFQDMADRLKQTEQVEAFRDSQVIRNNEKRKIIQALTSK